MKIYLIVPLLFLTAACTRTITIDESGTTKQITVNKKHIIQEEVQVESTLEGEETNTTQSCSKMGICCKCGFTLSMEHECSCGTWRNCPGTQAATVKPVTKTFRYHYTIKKDSGIPQKYQSPIITKNYKKTVSTGSCN